MVKKVRSAIKLFPDVRMIESGDTKATVQDCGTHMGAVVLYNRGEFVTVFEAIGYEVVVSWKVWGPSLKVVGKPEFSAFPYSGFFFRPKEQVLKRGGIKNDTAAGANDKKFEGRLK